MAAQAQQTQNQDDVYFFFLTTKILLGFQEGPCCLFPSSKVFGTGRGNAYTIVEQINRLPWLSESLF